jgi:hypothetical protein
MMGRVTNVTTEHMGRPPRGRPVSVRCRYCFKMSMSTGLDGNQFQNTRLVNETGV